LHLLLGRGLVWGLLGLVGGWRCGLCRGGRSGDGSQRLDHLPGPGTNEGAYHVRPVEAKYPITEARVVEKGVGMWWGFVEGRRLGTSMDMNVFSGNVGGFWLVSRW